MDAASAAARRHPNTLDYGISAMRIAIGWIFLWAFLDKLFGLGFATERANAWLNGGSPTQGFLSFATQGPFASLFQAMAGEPVVDALFMLGLAGVGVSLLTGIALRIGAIGGMAMLGLMWLAVLPPENNPFMDEHIVYMIALFVVQAHHAHDVLSLRNLWLRIPYVRAHSLLH